jgi:hypothetical protein
MLRSISELAALLVVDSVTVICELRHGSEVAQMLELQPSGSMAVRSVRNGLLRML